jgi:hypothetical protein
VVQDNRWDGRFLDSLCQVAQESPTSQQLSWPRTQVVRYADEFRKNGIWEEDGRVFLEGDDAQEVAVSFALSVGVALGQFERIQVPDCDGDGLSEGEFASGSGLIPEAGVEDDGN